MASDLVPGLEGDSILEQMNKLFEPPGKTEQEVIGEQHPYFKRPGKGHNHDCCDSCSEGGALICCDLCPASFHLQCHDPPLSDSEIPEGDWSCIQCFARTPHCQKLVEEARKEIQATSKVKRETSAKAGKIKPDNAGKAKQDAKAEAEKIFNKSPAKVDSEWKPGSKKKLEIGRPGRSTREASKRTLYADHSTEDEDEDVVPRAVIQVRDRDLVPIIDPVFAHSGKNYKQLYVEHLSRKPRMFSNPFSTLLAAATYANATEFQLPHSYGCTTEKFPYSWKWSSEADRKRLKGVDGDELEPGLNKVRLCYTCVRSSRVGPLVRCDYCTCAFHMDCLNPPLSEVPSDVWMCPNHVENLLDNKFLGSTSATERVRLWDKYARQPVDSHAVKLQFMKRCQRAKNPHFNRKVPVSLKKRVMVPLYIKAHYRQPSNKMPGPSSWQGSGQGSTCNGNKGGQEEEMEWLASMVSFQTQIVKEKVEQLEGKLGERTDKIKIEQDASTNKTEDNRTNVEMEFSQDSTEVESNRKVDNDKNKEIERNGTEEIGHSPASTLSNCSLSPRHTASLASHPSLSTQLCEYLAQHSDMPIKQLEPAVLQYLAHKQLQTIFPPPLTSPQHTVRARASLTPIGSRRSPALMQYRSITIGAGQYLGVDLLAYGNCNHLSEKHAVIFYDELSGEYELLNYSTHGSKVDNVLYCLNLSGMEERFPVKKTVSPGDIMASKLGPGQKGVACHCDPVPKAGCEGSAIVKHGSLLQFGCIQFVFSLVEGSYHDMY